MKSARKEDDDAPAKNREDSCERRSREFNDIPDYAGTWRERKEERAAYEEGWLRRRWLEMCGWEGETREGGWKQAG